MIGKSFDSSRMRTVTTATLIVLALLWPAIWNGFPLFFSDSGAYLHVGWGQFWLMDRSSFYGIFLKPFVMFSDMPGLWLGLIPQLVVLAWLIVACAKRLEARNWQLVIPVLLAATTGPWHASQLMPDAFAPAIILLGWICATRDPGQPGSPLLLFAAAAVSLTHSTYPALFFASGAATLLVLWLGGLELRKVGRRLAGLMISISITVVTQLGANGYYAERAVYAPKSAAFLYASLNEDGLIEPWLRKNCPTDVRVKDLCRIAPTFPRDSQELLWGHKSPFKQTVWVQFKDYDGPDWETQLGIAARSAIIQSPFQFARAALSATAEQFFSFRVLDDECPDVCLSYEGALQHAFNTLKPSLQEEINTSPQLNGRLRTYPLQAITGLTSHVGLVGIFVLLPIAWRRRDAVAGSLLTAVLAALLANAFVTGTLSDVHDRYQSRVIWITPIICVLMLLRWRAQSAGTAARRMEDQAGVPEAATPTPPAPAPS